MKKLIERGHEVQGHYILDSSPHIAAYVISNSSCKEVFKKENKNHKNFK